MKYTLNHLAKTIIRTTFYWSHMKLVEMFIRILFSTIVNLTYFIAFVGHLRLLKTHRGTIYADHPTQCAMSLMGQWNKYFGTCSSFYDRSSSFEGIITLYSYFFLFIKIRMSRINVSLGALINGYYLPHDAAYIFQGNKKYQKLNETNNEFFCMLIEYQWKNRGI